MNKLPNNKRKSWIILGIFLMLSAIIGFLIAKEKVKRENKTVDEIVEASFKETENVSLEESKVDNKVKIEESVCQYETVIVERLIAKHTIDNPNSYDARNTNMAVAASIINGKKNGYILKPGEKFSWIKVVGQTTEEKGFKEAGIILYQKPATGLGGGVCQVSSTINSAIQKTGIKTGPQYLHAEEHSLASSYIKKERGDKEARVSFDSGADFWFVNTLKYPIRIKVKTKGNKVTVKIFLRKKKKIEL